MVLAGHECATSVSARFYPAGQPLVNLVQQLRVIFIHHIDFEAGGARERLLIGHAKHARLIALVIDALNQVGHHHIRRFLPQRFKVIDIVFHPNNLRLLDMFIDKALVGAARIHHHLHVWLVDFFQLPSAGAAAQLASAILPFGTTGWLNAKSSPALRFRHPAHGDIKLIGLQVGGERGPAGRHKAHL